MSRGAARLDAQAKLASAYEGFDKRETLGRSETMQRKSLKRVRSKSQPRERKFPTEIQKGKIRAAVQRGNFARGKRTITKEQAAALLTRALQLADL